MSLLCRMRAEAAGNTETDLSPSPGRERTTRMPKVNRRNPGWSGVTMGVPVDLLRRVTLLFGLADDELAALAARFRERIYDAGAPVTTRGGTGAGFFVIAEGEALVGTPDRPTARLGPRDFFGEIAVIDGGRRSADITAATNMRCWGISQREFRAFVKQHPEVAWALLEVLVARLRAAEAAAGWRGRPARGGGRGRPRAAGAAAAVGTTARLTGFRALRAGAWQPVVAIRP